MSLESQELRMREIMENLKTLSDAEFVTTLLKLDHEKDEALFFTEFLRFLDREMLLRILDAVKRKLPPAYDPALNFSVPRDIMDAAEKVATYAAQQGWRNWAIGPVADRRLTGL
jgi:hypothetical protein